VNRSVWSDPSSWVADIPAKRARSVREGTYDAAFRCLAGRASSVRSGTVGFRPPSGKVTFLFTDIEGSTPAHETSACKPNDALLPSSSSIKQTLHDLGQPCMRVHRSAPTCTPSAFGTLRSRVRIPPSRPHRCWSEATEGRRLSRMPAAPRRLREAPAKSPPVECRRARAERLRGLAVGGG
jgi:hypothetical protein